MTSKIVVNNIQADAGVSTVTFASNVSAPTFTGNVNATSGVTTVTTLNATSIVGVSSVGVTTAYVTSINEGQLQGYRNMLYNGAMVVNQRGYTSAASTSTGYSVDRWTNDVNHSAVVAIGQSTSAAAQPTGQGFTNSLHYRVTTASGSLSAGQYLVINQRLEGYDVQRIKKGSSNAEPVTLSFWVRSSKIGTYIAELFDYDNTRQVSKSYSINSANTWEKKIITFPADTTGAFDNDNAVSLYVDWWLAGGSDFTSGTLNTSWAANTNANRAVNQVNFLDTAGAQFNITGCQLEVGPNATEFEFRSYGDELRMCQRYYYTVGGETIYQIFGTGQAFSTTQFNSVVVPFPVNMRTMPTFSYSSLSHFTVQNSSGSGIALNAFSQNSTESSSQMGVLRGSVASGLTAGNATPLLSGGFTSARVNWSAEI